MREPEGAVFERARVARRRDRGWWMAAAVLVGIGGLAVAGLGGRGGGAGAERPDGGSADASVGLVALETTGLATVAPPPTGQSRPTFGPQPIAGPGRTSGPGQLELTARRQPDSVLVHGDVFVADVTWVFVSLKDASGRMAGWASISVPGAVGPRASDGPSLRFDVELAAAYAGFPGTLTLLASAHDSSGNAIAVARIDGLSLVEPSVVPPRVPGAVDGGFRPGAHFPLLDASWGDEP